MKIRRWPLARVVFGASAGSLAAAVLASSASAQTRMPLAGVPEQPIVQVQADNPVSASELKDAIADIKRRLAQQQEGRQSTSTSELTAELKAARENISELTQGMNRLRAERDKILSEMRSMGDELGLRSDQIASLERQMEALSSDAAATEQELQGQLAERLSERDQARLELAQTASQLEVALSEISNLTDALDSAEAERSALEQTLEQTRDVASGDLAERDRVINAAEAEVDRLSAELEVSTADLGAAGAAVTELQIQLQAMTTAAQTTAQQQEQVAEQVALLEETIKRETGERQQAEAALSEQRERVRQVSLEAEGRLKERTATLTTSIQNAEQRIGELETEMAGLREVATTSVGEVQGLGEQLLVTLRENEELVTALAEVRASKSIIESELEAARRDVDLYASQAALGARGDGGEIVERLQSELKVAKEENRALSEQLIRQDQLTAATDGDPGTLGQQLTEVQSALEASEALNAQLSQELAALKGEGEATPQTQPGIQLASFGDDEIDSLLEELNAVDSGGGWVMTIPEGIVFAPGSDQLADAAAEPLSRVAQMLDYFGSADVRIVGHTDSYGDPDVNKVLSIARAESVRDYLAANFGLDLGRVETDGFGEEQPIASNDSVSGRRANRRVEVYVNTSNR